MNWLIQKPRQDNCCGGGAPLSMRGPWKSTTVASQRDRAGQNRKFNKLKIKIKIKKQSVRVRVRVRVRIRKPQKKKKKEARNASPTPSQSSHSGRLCLIPAIP